MASRTMSALRERYTVRERENEYLTPKEVATLLRVSYPTVIRLINDGEFDAIRVGAQWRIRRESVLRRLE